MRHGNKTFRDGLCDCATCRIAYAKAERAAMKIPPAWTNRPDPDFKGLGIIGCLICGRKYRDHDYAERCYR